jgi:hypothetical protein
MGPRDQFLQFFMLSGIMHTQEFLTCKKPATWICQRRERPSGQVVSNGHGRSRQI